MSNENCHLPTIPEQYCNSAIFSILQGTNFIQNLLDKSVDNKLAIPIKRDIYEYTITNSDFVSGGNKNPTLFLNQSRGFKINMLFLEFVLPPQFARSSYDQMCYDTLPGINCINRISTCIKNNETESITSQNIIKRYLDYFGYDLFEQYAEDWWGGIRTDKKCSPHQKLHGTLNGFFDPVDINNNIILPALKIILPLPVSFLFNNERHCFLLASKSVIECVLSFKTASELITRNVDAILTPIAGTLSLVCEYLNPCELGNHFNNLSYVNTSKRKEYFFKDHFYESTPRSISCNSEIKFNIQYFVTKAIDIYVYDPQFIETKQFFGDTCDMATKNWIASMIHPFDTNRISATTINFRTGEFLGPEKKTHSLCSIIGHTARSLKLQWKKTANINQDLTITCDTPWAELGDLYIDLSTFQNTLPCLIVCPQIFHLKSFNLKIIPFVQTKNLDMFADPKCNISTSQIVANGYFTLGFDDIIKKNKYVFMGVNNIVKNLQESTWAYLISQHVPTSHGANELVAKKFPIVCRNNFQFFDLDSINKIKVKDFAFDHGAKHDPIPDKLIKYKHNYFKQKNYFDPQLTIDYNFKNSDGYEDFANTDITAFSFKLQSEPINWDGFNVSDIIKDKNARHLSFLVIQSCVRASRYTENLTIEFLDDEDRREINEQLIDKILDEKYYTAKKTNDNEYKQSNKRRFNEPELNLGEFNSTVKKSRILN